MSLAWAVGKKREKDISQEIWVGLWIGTKIFRCICLITVSKCEKQSKPKSFTSSGMELDKQAKSWSLCSSHTDEHLSFGKEFVESMFIVNDDKLYTFFKSNVWPHCCCLFDWSLLCQNTLYKSKNNIPDIFSLGDWWPKMWLWQAGPGNAQSNIL